MTLGDVDIDKILISDKCSYGKKGQRFLLDVKLKRQLHL